LITGALVPAREAQFAAEMQHQRFQRRRRIEWKAHGVQFRFGRYQIGAEAPQIFDQHQRMFLFFVEPDRHESGKIRIVLVVAQEHLGRRQCRPFGDRVHLDRLCLFFAQQARVERRPWDIGLHVPTRLLEFLEQLRVQHESSPTRAR